jgi:Putative zinc-finger
MQCDRAFRVDLAEVLLPGDAPGAAAFRAHYPTCRECAAEVRAWTEVGLLLGGGGPHPAEAQLLGFEDRPETLPAVERAAVAAHLAGCAPCRDELAALRRFDPAALAVRVPARTPPPARRFRWRAIGRLVWHPAFAYALALLVAIPFVLERFAARPVPRTDVAREEAPRAAGGRAGAPTAAAPAGGAQESLADAGAAAGEARLAKRSAAAETEGTVAAGRERDAADETQAAPPAAPEPKLAARQAPGAAMPMPAVPAGGTVELRAGGAPSVRLRLGRPAAAATGPAEVVVVSPDGRRELHERVTVPAAGPVEVDLPIAWLGGGTQRVELRRDGAVLAAYGVAVAPPR